ncbi:MAG: hypothetical protein A4E19_03395 [Nitrospira sp. SG-bin1]|nr:MAG: hypothetical protein A4E19_03395 [Nitrospira sp. SG-bin1]
MGPLEELRLHVDALCLAVDANPKFFASIKHYVAQFQQLLIGPKAPTVAELQVLATKIEEFWSKWRPSGGDGFYIPPRETEDTDSTVQRLNVIVHDLVALKETEFKNLATRFIDGVRLESSDQHDMVR